MHISSRGRNIRAVKMQVCLVVPLLRESAFVYWNRSDSGVQGSFHFFALRACGISYMSVMVIISVPYNSGTTNEDGIITPRFIVAPYIPVANVSFVHKTPGVCGYIIPPVEAYRNI